MNKMNGAVKFLIFFAFLICAFLVYLSVFSDPAVQEAVQEFFRELIPGVPRIPKGRDICNVAGC